MIPNPLKPITVVIVDDHKLVRTGLARMIDDEIDMRIIAEAATGEEALQICETLVPDIVLMDARMPGIGGIEATLRLLKNHPKLRVIAMSSVTSGIIPSQMLRSGAKAFITKNIGVEEMLKSIRVVYEGQHYVTADAAIRLALDPFNRNQEPLFDKLSRRELQIAQMLTDGKKVSQISEFLQLSPKTVYSYRYRLFEKLGIHSDVELTILAVKFGLSDDLNDFGDSMPRVGLVAS
ncbi:MAG: two-component system invasion response regulator UvrY [Pseudohongiellaceae bacterium]|jgi:two-component system invasion response regulator UvrY